jgi:hypothetical protein
MARGRSLDVREKAIVAERSSDAGEPENKCTVTAIPESEFLQID